MLTLIRKHPFLMVSITLFFSSLLLLGAEKLVITQRRAHYFLLKINGSSKYPIKKGQTGTLYIDKNSKPVGTFYVQEVWQGQCLCKIDSQSLVGGTDIEKILLATLDVISIKKTPRVEQPIIISGKRFTPLPGRSGYYLTEKAVPLQRMTPPDISGIKSFLFSLEKKHGYSADMIPFSRINGLGLGKRINFANPDILLLGTFEGKPCMIYEEDGTIQHTELSAMTMKQFQKELHVHILLKRKLTK